MRNQNQKKKKTRLQDDVCGDCFMIHASSTTSHPSSSSATTSTFILALCFRSRPLRPDVAVEVTVPAAAPAPEAIAWACSSCLKSSTLAGGGSSGRVSWLLIPKSAEQQTAQSVASNWPEAADERETSTPWVCARYAVL